MDNQKTENIRRLSSVILVIGTLMLGIATFYEYNFSKQYYSCVPDALKELHDTESLGAMMDYLKDCQYSPSLHVDEWYILFLLSFLLVALGTTLGAIPNIIKVKKEE